MKKQRVEVLSDRSRIPSDGRSSAKVCLRSPEWEGDSVELRLTRGSFSPDSIERQASVPVVNNEVNVTIYAPNRPGAGFLTGPGIRHRLEFAAASHFQALVFDWIPTLGLSLLLALVLRSYALASYFIPSGSMEHTLMPGDLLIAEKASFKLLSQEPRRGDIVIFIYPEKDKGKKKLDYIKRCIGLPGDKIEVREGVVYVNSEPLKEDYIAELPDNDYGPVTVPEGHYFMMGDNRNRSSDSRVWGFVPRKNLEGRAMFVFWPPRHMKTLPNGLEGQEPGPHTAVAAE